MGAGRGGGGGGRAAPAPVDLRDAKCNMPARAAAKARAGGFRGPRAQRPARAACAHPGPPPSRGLGHKVKDEVLWLLLSEVVP